MLCRLGPLVLLLTLVLACVTGIGSLTSALWLAHAQEIPVAIAILTFTLFVAPSEIVCGVLIAARLARRRPYVGIIVCLCAWMATALVAVSIWFTLAPDLELLLRAGLVVAMIGGVWLSSQERALWPLLRTGVPWLAGAAPLWLLSLRGLPASMGELLLQGGLMFLGTVLPLALYGAVLQRQGTYSFTRS